MADEQYRPTSMPPEGSQKGVQKGTQPGHSAAGTLAHLHCVAAVRKISNRVTRVSPVLSLFCKPSCARDATSNNPCVFFPHQWCISSHSSTFSFNIRDLSYSFHIPHRILPHANCVVPSTTWIGLIFIIGSHARREYSSHPANLQTLG